MSLKTKTTKVEIRLTPEEKLDWQTQADAENVSVSQLIRARMWRPTAKAVAEVVPAAADAPAAVEDEGDEDEVIELELPTELIKQIDGLISPTGAATRDAVIERIVDRYIAKQT
jgi:hypothetical protein